MLLGVISVVAGFIPFGEFVTWNREAYHIHLNLGVAAISMGAAVIGIVLATVLYRKENAMPTKMADSCRGLWKAAYKRFYMDELYLFITHKIIFGCISKPIAWFDKHIIDATFDMLANVTNQASFAIRKLQSGNIQTYVWVYLMGALSLVVITILCLI